MNRKIQRPASAMSGIRQPVSRPPSRASVPAVVALPVVEKPEKKKLEAPSETNIQVVVRCRDRNERERLENSSVIISTKVEPHGKAITIQTSPLTELNNKTYTFDRVYGAEATQSMVFDDTVEPIVQEMLGGYNCTIFAYGQTGTGKTYTMSGDMSDYYGKVTDAAGIIPRALYRIFQMLDLWGDEYSVKCSFIELYNEELRDLLAIQDDQKVKIFDDTTKKGGIIINGMEELVVNDAMHGVKILQDGSRKREVAATKCNEVSSRSHSVFTITVHIKQTSTEGEDMLRVGKLNLVDLAGSENVGRSGAENKRAREAGMINQSLLTLGRVINALVDRSQHIPYRESKLTRLLQDSLGGRTKTCIIATLSPAKVNMDETVSTLEYANRAKSIKNKPQVNQMMTKKALIKDYILEIERLKGDLNSTRQKNGVYMTEESHLELVNQNESNKLLTEEQQRKIDAMNEQIRVAKENFEETMASLTETKRELERTSKTLDLTQGKLDQTERTLSETTTNLENETCLRKAHQSGEENLDQVAKVLKATLQSTISDVHALHSKVDRKRSVEERNRATWTACSRDIQQAGQLIDATIQSYGKAQSLHLQSVSDRMTEFVVREMKLFSDGHQYIENQMSVLGKRQDQVNGGFDSAKTDMDEVLAEIATIRQEVKSRLGLGLTSLNKAAERIAEEIACRMGEFQQEVHDSYSLLGSNFKQIFDGTQKHIHAQSGEIKKLKQELQVLSAKHAEQITESAAKARNAQIASSQVSSEQEEGLLLQISEMIKTISHDRQAREQAAQNTFQESIKAAVASIQDDNAHISTAIDLWTNADEVFGRKLAGGKEEIKRSIVNSAKMANDRTGTMQESTKVIHAETVELVDAAMRNVDDQTAALDEFVGRAKTLVSSHHTQHRQAVSELVKTAEKTSQSVQIEFKNAKAEIESCSKAVLSTTDEQRRILDAFGAQTSENLGNITQSTTNQMQDDVATQTTPKKQEYKYPSWTTTRPHAELLAERAPAPVLVDVDRNVPVIVSPVIEKKMETMIPKHSLDLRGQENRPAKTRKRLQ